MHGYHHSLVLWWETLYDRRSTPSTLELETDSTGAIPALKWQSQYPDTWRKIRWFQVLCSGEPVHLQFDHDMPTAEVSPSEPSSHSELHTPGRLSTIPEGTEPEDDDDEDFRSAQSYLVGLGLDDDDTEFMSMYQRALQDANRYCMHEIEDVYDRAGDDPNEVNYATEAFCSGVSNLDNVPFWNYADTESYVASELAEQLQFHNLPDCVELGYVDYSWNLSHQSPPKTQLWSPFTSQVSALSMSNETTIS